MTASPLDDLTSLAEQFRAPHPAALHCGQAILSWIRDLPPKAPTLPGAVNTAMMLGLRVVPNHRLDTGQWQVYDQYGALMQEGRVGEPGELVMWVRGQFMLFTPTPLDPAVMP